ncbi:MAG: C10 family peptidase [Bacteroidales bacterium]|nr:C10 family peptidase [Bacteroidales bacterium]
MKRTLQRILFTVVAVLLLQGYNGFTEPVSFDMARRAAEGLLGVHDAPGFSLTGQYENWCSETEELTLYVFLLNPAGFIVTTDRTTLPPVLFYSLESDPEPERRSEFTSFLLYDAGLRNRLVPQLPARILAERERAWEHLAGGRKSAEFFEQWPPSGSTPTGGWLMENWHQSPPYNNFCPMDPVTGGRSVAGCPATAMAMIVDHFKTVNGTLFTNEDDYYHSYQGRNYWIDDDYIQQDFLSFPQINGWLDSIQGRWLTGSPLKNDERAALTFACGAAARQVYTSSVSGTFGVVQAYNAYLKFGFDQCELIDESDTSLYSRLSHNMKHAQPAHLAVVTPQWDMGHNVVVDGYNTDDYYHINFGWGGTYNGWYLIPDEIPYGLTVIEGLVIDIFDIQTGTGDNASKMNAGLQVFPNPSADWITVELPAGVSPAGLIRIYTGSGIQIKEMNTPANIATDNIRLRLQMDISGLPSGIYILSWLAGEQAFHSALIINH